jgi:hypothetical protein
VGPGVGLNGCSPFENLKSNLNSVKEQRSVNNGHADTCISLHMERQGQCRFMDIGHTAIYAHEDNEYMEVQLLPV